MHGFRILILALLSFGMAGAPRPTSAHSFEPSLLAISERAAGEYDVLWRPPAQSSGYNLSTLDIQPLFAPHCQSATPVYESSDALQATRFWRLRCTGDGLRGSTLNFPGLDGTQLDVVVRVVWLDQSMDTTVLRSGASTYELRALVQAPSRGAAAGRYARLGVEHILLGFDHLTFVLALFLLVANTTTLIKTITAFTLGHSLTLGLATFEVVVLPAPLTEALIALSIAFVAHELLQEKRTVPSLARTHPWIVALGFGLLHGLGFAAALGELGFAADKAWLALASFNLGVEIGQLAFVLGLAGLARLAPSSALPHLRLALPYAIGSLAFVWVFERIARFWSLPTS